MTKQKINIKIISGSSIRLGRGSYILAAIRPYTLQCKAMQNRIPVLAVADCKCYKTS